MTLQEAMNIRRSRRKYITTPIDTAIIKKLDALAREYSQTAGVRIEFVWNDGSAWGGLRKSYGMFSGVRNYAGLIAAKDDLAAIERLGYYGELLTLHAVSLGLGTCWVGGSFSRKLCPIKLSGDEMVICTIAMGYTPEQNSAKEKLIHKITHRKTKAVEEMMTSDAPTPDWFMEGMRAVQKAPSAVNRQPVMFTYKNSTRHTNQRFATGTREPCNASHYEGGKVTAGVKNYSDIGSVLDLGIAKSHFELGAGRGKWNFGNHTEFEYQEEE